MDLRGKLLEMLQAQETGLGQGAMRGRDGSSRSDSRSGSSFSSRSSPSPRRRSRRAKRSRSRSNRRERTRGRSRGHRRSRERGKRERRRGRSRSRSSRRNRGYRDTSRRYGRDRPRLGNDFKDKRAPDGRPYCIDFKLGRCRRGEYCRYYHQEKEKCLDYARGRCTYGDRCKFAHPDGGRKDRRSRGDSEKRNSYRKARSKSEEEALARRRAERRGMKYEKGTVKEEKTTSNVKDEESTFLPSLVQTTEVDVTKSEPFEEHVDETQEIDENEDKKMSKANELVQGEEDEEFEDKADIIEEKPMEEEQEEEVLQEVDAEEGEVGFEPAACDEPDEPITMKAEAMEEEEETGSAEEREELQNGSQPGEAQVEARG